MSVRSSSESLPLNVLAVADGPLGIVASSTLLAILLVRLAILTCGFNLLARFAFLQTRSRHTL